MTNSGPAEPVRLRSVRTQRPISAVNGARVAASHASIKESNLLLVAEELFGAGGGLSRADLSVRTGLTRATVSRLVKQLLDLELITESEPNTGGVAGRPGTPLFPVVGTIVGIGLEINADRVGGAAVDLAGNVVAAFDVKADLVQCEPAHAFALLTEELVELQKQLDADGVQEITGYYLAIPGVVDEASKRVIYAPNLGWRGVYPEEYLRPVLGDVPFRVDNDANLQALAGAAASQQPDGPQSFLYLTGDVGIGGAMVKDGLIERGPHGWAGEIGHTTIDPDGPLCHCGSAGCLERYAGKQAILRASGLPDDAPPEDLIRELQKGSTSVMNAAERAGWALGIGLANATNLLDLDTIVLGTSLAPLLPWLRPSMEKELDRRLLGRTSSNLVVKGAPFLPNAATLGGALQASQGVLAARLGAGN